MFKIKKMKILPRMPDVTIIVEVRLDFTRTRIQLSWR